MLLEWWWVLEGLGNWVLRGAVVGVWEKRLGRGGGGRLGAVWIGYWADSQSNYFWFFVTTEKRDERLVC